MKFFIIALFFAFFFMEGVLAMALPGSTCSELIETQPNFDMEKYAGVWWEALRYDNPYERGLQCVTAQYTIANGSLATEHGAVREQSAVVSRAALSRADPSATDGKLLVNYANSPHSLPYWVLGTDYSSYSVVYSCTNLRNGGVSVTSWVLTRDPALNGVIISTVDNILKKSNLPWDPYIASFNTKAACEVAV